MGSLSGKIALGALLTLLVAGPAGAVNVSNEGYFPYFADGGGWKTTFQFTCLSSIGCNADISVRGSDGRNLPIRLRITYSDVGNEIQTDVAGSKFNLAIINNSSVIMETLGTAPALYTGGLDLVCNGPMSGYAVLRQKVEGRPDYEATVPMEPRTFFDGGSVAFDNRAGSSTGIALANLSTTAAAEIRIQGLDLGGNILFSTVIALEALNSMSFDVALRYPETRNKVGTVKFFVPGGQLGGMAFRFNATGPFTTVPFFTANNR